MSRRWLRRIWWLIVPLALGCGAGLGVSAAFDLPRIETLELSPPKLTTVLLDRNGEVFDRFYTQRRMLVQYEQIVEHDPERLTEPAPLEHLDADVQAPAIAVKEVPGGTGVLTDQSQCPFRAFAIHRLGAIDTTPPRPGLDAMQRGSLLHKALERFWRDIPDHAALISLTDTALADLIRESVDHALDELTTRYRLSLTRSGYRLEPEVQSRSFR